MIKLTTQKCKSNLTGSEYWKVAMQSGSVVGLDKISRKIADATGYNKQQVKGIIGSMWQSVFDELEDGQSVQLGEITLKPSLSVQTHKTEAECSAKDVKVIRFIATTTSSLNSMRKNIQFSLNGKTTMESVPTEGDEDVEGGETPAPSGVPSQSVTTQTGGTSSGTQKHTVAWYQPNGNPIIWYELAEGEIIPDAPQAPEGYYWHPYPATMPDHDLDIIPEPNKA